MAAHTLADYRKLKEVRLQLLRRPNMPVKDISVRAEAAHSAPRC